MNFPIPRNVGRVDRALRVVGGAAVVAAPVLLGAGVVVAAPVALLGAGVAASGALGRCSVYHALGLSTLDAPDVGQSG
jgi:hypothetical protein